MGHIEETLSDAGQSSGWTDDEGGLDMYNKKAEQNPLAEIETLMNEEEDDMYEDEEEEEEDAALEPTRSSKQRVIEDDFDPASETVLDRIAALKDIIRPTLRYKVQKRTAAVLNASLTTSKVVGNMAWILATTAIVTVFPLIMCSEKEAGYMAWENEQKMVQQGQEMLASSQTPGANAGTATGQATPFGL